MIQIQKILCPVDFFPASLHAFDYALKFAKNYGAAVHAVHVIAPVIPAAYGSPINVSAITADMVRQAKQLLKKLEGKAQKAGVTLKTEVLQGDISERILHAVRTSKSDMVVMATHGRRGFQRWLMGSSAERMMRICPVPLLVLGSSKPSAPPLRRILLTTDFSEGTADAVSYAFSIAQENQSDVTFLHVVHDLSAELGGSLTQPLIAGIRAKLDELVPDEARVWCKVETRVEAGDPFRVIAEILKSEKVGLIVMNIHGKGMLHRALIGTTAERVVRTSADKCPVLLIPPSRSAKGKKSVKTTTGSRKRRRVA